MPNAYAAPLKHIRSSIDLAAATTGLQAVPAARESLADVADSVLENAARFAHDVLSPLNPIGDRAPAKCTPEGVVTSPGFADAYRRFRDDGWTSLSAPTEDGGMGLPTLIAVATGEMWAGANLAFAMCPEVAVGAVEALRHHAPASLREQYLPQVVSGEWTAAMSLTEPQAGSDLRPCAHARSWRKAGIQTRRVTPREARGASSAARSTSPGAITISPTTSCTSCWRARRTRRKACAASRCSSCPKGCRAQTASSFATTFARSRSSTRWAFAQVRRAPW